MSVIKVKNGSYYRLDPADQKRTGVCVSAYPIGGGMGFLVPVGDVVEWDAQPEHVYHKGWVGFEDDRQYIQAWTSPTERWNGWAKPYAERAEVEKFLAKQQAHAKAYGNAGGFVTGRFDGNVLVVHDPNYNDPDMRVPAETILVPDGDGRRSVEVWDLSLGLIWDECPNPRFVWIVGSVREEFPDVPESMDGQLVLWDRQEKKEVAVVFGAYAQAVCLEKGPNSKPFTALCEWFNWLGKEALESENIPATTEAYHD